MNTEQVKKKIRRLEVVKTWQLVVVLILMALLAATFLRLNNIGMVERRSAVIAADESGDSLAMQERLYELQRYSMTHMNANTGPFTLKEQHNRDVQTIAKQAQDGAGDSKADSDRITAKCRQETNSTYGTAWVQCFADAWEALGADNSLAELPALPDVAAYRVEFVSPLWTPDFAGFTVAICVLILLAIIARIIGVIILRIILRHRYKTI